MRYVVAVDVDGVLADSLSAMLSVLTETLGRAIGIHELRWDFAGLVTPDEARAILIRALEQAQPVPGAHRGLRQLCKIADTVYILSDREPDMLYPWIERYGFDFVDAHYAEQRKLNWPWTVLIDDSPRYIAEFAEAWSMGRHRNRRLVAWQSPYNLSLLHNLRQDDLVGPIGPIVQVAGWDAAVAAVQRLREAGTC